MADSASSLHRMCMLGLAAVVLRWLGVGVGIGGKETSNWVQSRPGPQQERDSMVKAE